MQLPIGHHHIAEDLARQLEANRLAHGFIFSGIKGIGKASFAKWFAHQLLTSAGENKDSAWQRMQAGSHADFLVIEPLFDEKKEEYAREISAEQGREISKFLALTPAESRWRVVIIDSADQLNHHSANAILKILEEPPAHCILLLIAHQPGLLLSTIRSRCQLIRFSPLARNEFATAIEALLPDTREDTIAALAQLTGGAPGKALELEEQGALSIYQDILGIVGDTPDIAPEKIYRFAENYLSSKPHQNWRLITMLTLFLLERACKQATGIEHEGITRNEAIILQKLGGLYPAAVWGRKWQQCADQFYTAERLHLDYKQVIITFFHSIVEKEGNLAGSAAA